MLGWIFFSLSYEKHYLCAWEQFSGCSWKPVWKAASAADLGWSVGGLKSFGSISETLSHAVLWSFLELSHIV